MRLAFTLFEYFRFGGLQRDFLHVARRCVERGHDVHVFTREWDGELPDGMSVERLAVSAWTNVGRDEAFIRAVGERLAGERYDGVVGFNKMPGLDVYYAADPCLAHRARQPGVLMRHSRRIRKRIEWERAVFGADSTTHVLLIAHDEKRRFQEHHGTPDERFHRLPPNLTPDVRNTDAGARERVWRELDVASDAPLLLCVGSSFKTKGLDRSIAALAALEDERARLVVVGRGDPGPYARIARKLGVEPRVRFAGARDDVASCYAAADLLLHPARTENTGTVLLEALVNGLGVVASGVCGFATHVRSAGAGIVLAEPFEQAELDHAVRSACAHEATRREWAAAGRRYGETEDLDSGHDAAARAIEAIARAR